MARHDLVAAFVETLRRLTMYDLDKLEQWTATTPTLTGDRDELLRLIREEQARRKTMTRW